MNRVGAVDKMTLGATTDFKPGTAMTATSSIEISISCRNLANKDVLSKSDPICIVYQKAMHSKQWAEVLRTEILQNNLNPDFAKKLCMEYRFEQSQNMRFEVYDIDSPTSILDDQDGIGYIECTVANIVSAGANGYKEELLSLTNDNEGSNGTIILIAEELASLKDELSKINDAQNFLLVHRSKEVRGTNPLWPTLVISGRSLCSGDKDRQLKVEAYRKNLKDEDDLIGSCFTTLNRMTSLMDGCLQLKNKNGGTTKSSVSVLGCSIAPVFTFLDFIQAGTRLHLCFSIDFTSSNGDPTQVTSLHHISKDPKVSNPYEQAIEATGQIVKDYDNTGIFPVFGFGARIPPKGMTSHEFPVTLATTPNCKGISGVLRAYRQCISRIQLFGPTNFAPVINRVSEMASKAGRTGQHYYVLVILTDGVITDMPQTKEAIVNAAGYPVSIIIVGVGESDFSSMEELDGDEGTVSYMGKYAERDIVQFVAYRSAESWLHKTGETTAQTLQNGTQQAPPAFGGSGIANVVSSAKREMTNIMAQGQLVNAKQQELQKKFWQKFQSSLQAVNMKGRGIQPSMVVKDELTEIFALTAGTAEVVRTASTVDKFRQAMVEKEDEFKMQRETERRRQEEEEKKRRRKVNIWKIFSIMSKGKNKFMVKPNVTQQQQPTTDPSMLEDTTTDLKTLI